MTPSQKLLGSGTRAVTKYRRNTDGCLTCRLRKKRCDGRTDPTSDTCITCERLDMTCYGFQKKRPAWMKGYANEKRIRASLAVPTKRKPKTEDRNGCHWTVACKQADENAKANREQATADHVSQETSDVSRIVPYQDWDDPLYTQLMTIPQLHFSDDIRETSSSSSAWLALPPIIGNLGHYIEPVWLTVTDADTDNYIQKTISRQFEMGDSELLRFDIAQVLIGMRTQFQAKSQSCRLLRQATTILWRQQDQNPELQANRELDKIKSCMKRQSSFSYEDAWTAVIAMSSQLFDGGTGAHWNIFRQFCVTYTKDICRRYKWAVGLILGLPESILRVMKITLWFDLLASLTLNQNPDLCDLTENLFSPTTNIRHPSLNGMSMLNIMGCEDRVVWAITEIIKLSKEKEQAEAKGSLSVRALVQRGSEIEQQLLPHFHVTQSHPLYNCNKFWKRWYTSEIYRTSALVLLNYVISGENPNGPEMVAALNNSATYILTIKAFAEEDYLEITRSTVFGIFISGCMTDNPEQQEIFGSSLESQYLKDKTGNTREVHRVMKEVWQARKNGQRDWRGILRRNNLLLI